MEPQAYICLVLHAHLPFVRHPEQNECLEERWLFEAINESYLPLFFTILAVSVCLNIFIPINTFAKNKE